MPKLIPELQEKFIAAARKRIFDGESGKMTIRQIAADCGTVAGTVYNYFPSKQLLIAAVIQEDWDRCIQQMDIHIETAQTAMDGLQGICAALRIFTIQHSLFWDHYGGSRITRGKLTSYHHQVINQIELPVRALLERFDLLFDPCLSMVIAEILLLAARSDHGFSLVKPAVNKLLS